jgi:hypothetical protein
MILISNITVNLAIVIKGLFIKYFIYDNYNIFKVK